jgi:hypothetical protein
MRTRWLVVTCVLLLACALASTAQATRGLTTGFAIDPALTDGSATANNVWIPRAVAEGAGMVRVNLYWDSVAPAHPPPGFVASDPTSPGYNWTDTDAAVRELTGHGIKVLLTIWRAPTWAEGPSRPSSSPEGSWEPSSSQYAAFATAAARRYDGSFPDPKDPGSFLPRVGYWQAWNEPNLSTYLNPQWRRAGGQWIAESPVLYRGLLNAFYAAVKGVSASNFVVTAGTAPYGDPPGEQRIPPVAFDRTLFCLRGGSRLKPMKCPNPAHLDAVSHHPYGIGGPLWHAENADDAAVPDIDKIARVLRAAERFHRVLPRGHKQLWVTEISWDSDPPDPNGVPIAEQARWYEQAMYVLWRQDVSTVLWLQIVDSPPIPNYGSTYQAGIYYLNGQPKPSAVAFRFPFVTRRLNRGHVQAWGRAPQAGKLTIKEQRGGSWRVLKRLTMRSRQVFVATLSLRSRVVLEATVGSQTSLPWTQG